MPRAISLMPGTPRKEDVRNFHISLKNIFNIFPQIKKTNRRIADVQACSYIKLCEIALHIKLDLPMLFCHILLLLFLYGGLVNVFTINSKTLISLCGSALQN